MSDIDDDDTNRRNYSYINEQSEDKMKNITEECIKLAVYDDDDETNKMNDSYINQQSDDKSKNITEECVKFARYILKALSKLLEYKEKLIAEFHQEDKIKKKFENVFCDIEPLLSLYKIIDAHIEDLTKKGIILLPQLFLKREIQGFLNIYKSFLKQYAVNSKWICQFNRNNERCQEICRKINDNSNVDECLTLECCHYSIFNSLFSFELMVDRYAKCFDENNENFKHSQEVKSIFRNILVSIPQDQELFIKTHHELQLLSSRTVHHNVNTKFIAKGLVTKYSKKNNSELIRQLVLFSDYLYVTTPAHHVNEVSKVRQELSLKSMKVSFISIDENIKSKPMFGLNINTIESNLEFYFEDEKTLNEWKERLELAISALNNFINPSKVPTNLGVIAPNWQKDESCGYCNGFKCCKKFTALSRRHHCRVDGLLYCDECSSNKVKLKFEKSNLSRVCNLCYIILEGKNDKSFSESDVIEAKNQLNMVFERITRKGVKMGWLKFINFKNQSIQTEYYCVLDENDPFLHMYEKSEDNVRSHEIVLLGMKIEAEKNPKSLTKLKKNQFSIVHNDRQELYLFTASDENTKNDWVTKLEESLTKYCSRF